MREMPGFAACEAQVVNFAWTQDWLAALGGIELRHSQSNIGL
jgi:hypothetical protein